MVLKERRKNFMNHKCPACNYEYRFEGLKLVSGEEGICFYEIESEY
jgi:hypothetical protein